MGDVNEIHIKYFTFINRHYAIMQFSVVTAHNLCPLSPSLSLFA